MTQLQLKAIFHGYHGQWESVKQYFSCFNAAEHHHFNNILCGINEVCESICNSRQKGLTLRIKCPCVCLVVPAYDRVWASITLTNSSELTVSPWPCSHAWGCGLMDNTLLQQGNTSYLLTNLRKHNIQTYAHAIASTANSHTCPWNKYTEHQWKQNEAMWCQITAIICNT